VERFNRTFKSRLYRYFTAANTLKFVNVLQALVKGYNESKHRSIGMAPSDVTLKNEREVWDRLYGTKKKFKRPKLKVGD
ncbi:MAG: transposase, partial [Cohaesibacter sp.]|nr:transposase [Cohaesibacter sp.]